jgi:hypothetical protein
MTWAAVAIGGASLIGGVVAGSQASAAGKPAARAASQQADIARQLQQQTDPLRAALLTGSPAPGMLDLAGHAERGEVSQGRLALGQLRASGLPPEQIAELQGFLNRGDIAGLRAAEARLPQTGGRPGIFPEFLSTGELPEFLQPAPMFAGTREGLESQFDVARENILSRTGSRGGALQQALADVEIGRATSIGGLGADIAEKESALKRELFGQAQGLAFGTPQQSMAGLGSAGNLFSSLAQQSAAQQAAQQRTMGSSTALMWQALQGRGGGNTPMTSQDVAANWAGGGGFF